MRSNVLSTLFTLVTITVTSVLSVPFNVTTIHPRASQLGCGSNPSPSEVRTMESQFRELLRADEEARMPPTDPPIPDDPDPPTPPPGPPKPASVNVVWHNVYASTQAGNVGWLSDDLINKQMAQLNRDYRGLFTFKLTKINHVLNNIWHDKADTGNAEEAAMKKALRVGGPETLNIYSISMKSSSFIGYSSFPQDYNGNKVNDGIIITYTVLMNGGRPEYSLGRTLTHEVGHWTGLFHVFQGGCADGDGLSDTAPQAGPNFGCPTFADSCPGGRVDNIHNYMDYTNDACRTQFTKQQKARMSDMCRFYRNIYP
ncbi:hypothetical protein FRC15_001924 [Serendipita sp. 397]|nr:hypothetical protein FRC15_001924 [Serendipita sp. 397]